MFAPYIYIYIYIYDVSRLRVNYVKERMEQIYYSTLSWQWSLGYIIQHY